MFRECEAYLLTVAIAEIRHSRFRIAALELKVSLMANAPAKDLANFRSGLRADLQKVVARAKALGAEGKTEITGLHTDLDRFQEVVDEVKATRSEISGALLAEGDNGGEKLSTEGNATEASDAKPVGSATGGEPRATNFSDLHPAKRVQSF